MLQDGLYVVRWHGECDVSRYPELRQILLDVPQSARAVLLDLRDVTLLDSMSLAELLMAKDRWEKAGAVVATYVTHPGVARLLAIANLTEKLRVFGDEQAALHYLNDGRVAGREGP